MLSTLALLAALPAAAASYYTARLDDPGALYLTRDAFPVHADGIADDTDAVQQAIDKLQETHKQGVVFVPQGRYRLTRTIHVWAGIRLIGYGAQRPAFVLGANTPGFQDGPGKYMVHFVSWRPAPGEPIRDANPGTFYSAMSNIDIEIGAGNPAAVGIRFHVAQHGYLAHMDFRIGGGRAGIEDVGNASEDLHFYGGDYGIIAHKTSPAWQYVLLDSSFEGQRKAAIETQEAGLTLVRNDFKNVPSAISIDPDRPEELWIKDSTFTDVTGPAIVVADEHSARTQINVQNAVCRRVPVFAHLRESHKDIAAPGALYQVRDFTHGLQIADLGRPGAIQTTFDAAALTKAPARVPSDVPALPAIGTWVNVRTLGVKGDGAADDTEALRAAIAKNRTLYLPAGRYRVTDTIELQPTNVLIGLSPIATVIALDDNTPGFQGPGAPKPLLVAPKGGTNIVTGIGIDTGAVNSRAVGCKWMAGATSMLDDVRFHGGHGTYRLDASWEDIRRVWQRIYNSTHTADTDPKRRWDSQYYSLWVTDGGGGTFKDIWTPSTFAQAGAYISNTSTSGRVYALSVEHHVRNEVKLDHVSNWEIDALQLEEEWGESALALPLSVQSCRNITFANVFSYRVVGSVTPFPHAIQVADSQNIRFRGIHTFSDAKAAFDATLYDDTTRTEVRAREIASLTIAGNPAKGASEPKTKTEVERLATGFTNISGAAVDPNGDLWFVEPRRHGIHRWSVEKRAVTLVRDSPLDPAQLAFDKAGNVLVVSYGGKGVVYAFKPDAPESELTLLTAQPAAPRPGQTAVLPANFWRNEFDFLEYAIKSKPSHYVSPDGSTFIPAGEDFVTGALYYGVKMADLLRAYALASAVSGRPFYASDEREQKTYRFDVGADGTLSSPTLFANEGGTGVAVGPDGRVYLATDQVLVYDTSGKLDELIEVPERPIGLAFGGRDGRTLFILTRHSLYAASRTR